MNTELQPGTTIKHCAGCGIQYVVLEEFFDVSFYCSEVCADNHSILPKE